MMIKAPVIQIDRAASRHAVICHAHLGMTEPRCPLIDPYTILYQIVIERPGDTVDQFLIRNSRRDDPHIHAALGRQRKCMRHLIRDDQVRRHEPAVSVRFVDNTDIDIFPNLDPIQRTICIWLDISRLLCLIWVLYQIFFLCLYIQNICTGLFLPDASHISRNAAVSDATASPSRRIPVSFHSPYGCV